jgi:Fibronectin type III domain
VVTVSEQPAGAAAPPAGSARGGKKFMGLSPLGWAGVLALALAAGAYLLYRRSKAKATSTAVVTPTGTSTDIAGELATLQTEIMNLQASEASTGTGTGGGGTGGGGTGGGGGGTTKTGTSTGTSTDKPPPTSTGTGTGGKQAPPPGVTGLHVTHVTPTSISLAWNKSNGATSYQIRITYQSKVAKTQPATGTSGTVSGLTPDHTYGVHVVAIGPGGWAPETSTVVHTPKTAASTSNASAASVKKAG